MRLLPILLLLTTFATATVIGDLPTPEDLHLTEDDYFYLSGLSGLICGSIFSFMITR